MATKTAWTLADYMALPEGAPYELSEGELVVCAAPTFRHNEIRDLINASLRAWLRDHPMGVVTSESDFQLGPDTVRRPDVAFIRAERFQTEYESLNVQPMAPDLAVEIISSSDRPGAMQGKVNQYLAAGTVRVWVLYPEYGEAHLFTKPGIQPEVRSADRGEYMDAPELLPGWTMLLGSFLH
ncbi:MAG: Uma2 family endonuclease [Acidobacteria bacterium]|nr:MAG: Uma2 family endonuclease [Acidobacteriota bacterium]